MPETCENWLDLAFIMPTTPVKLPGTALLSGFLLGSFEINWVRQYLINVVLYEMNDLQKNPKWP